MNAALRHRVVQQVAAAEDAGDRPGHQDRAAVFHMRDGGLRHIEVAVEIGLEGPVEVLVLAEVKDRETLISVPVRGTAAMQEANFVADSLLEETDSNCRSLSQNVAAPRGEKGRLQSVAYPAGDRGFESPSLQRRVTLC